MPSLLLVVFALHLVIHLVNTIGAATISNILWNLYNLLPTPTSKALRERRKLQAEFVRVRKERHATSAQDQYAKWVKLDRQHNKLLDQLEKTKASLDTAKASFDRTVSVLRWIGTNGLRFFLQFWHQRQPMFWLPQGWVPYYAEWLLSCPRAPLGSISIQAWGLACAAVIELVSDAIAALVRLVVEAQAGAAQKAKGKPMKFGGEKDATPSASEKSSKSKKEL